MSIKVLIIDPYPIVILGCRTLLTRDPGIEVLEAADGGQGYDAFTRQRPDVTLIGFQLPDSSGIALMRRMLTKNSEAAVILVGTSDDPLFASQSLEAGARGYVSMREDATTMLRAVHDVAAGGLAVSAMMAKKIVGWRAREGDGATRLTPREREILRLLAIGRSMAEIADVINLSYKTVAANCMQLRSKLHARTTVELVHVAGLLGLL